jgi:hypothetical protein
MCVYVCMHVYAREWLALGQGLLGRKKHAVALVLLFPDSWSHVQMVLVIIFSLFQARPLL